MPAGGDDTEVRMKEDLRVSVTRWCDGSWAVVARTDQAGTLVESDGRAAARVVVAAKTRAVEATAQPVVYAKGLGRAVIAASIQSDGTRKVLGHRVFPSGAVRIDEIQRRGVKGERRSVWAYANGSRITAHATGSGQHVELFTREGQLAGTRTTRITERAKDRLAFQTIISDAGGTVVGTVKGTAQLTGGVKKRTMSGDGDAPQYAQVTAAGNVNGAPGAHSVVKNADGTTTVSDRQVSGNSTYSTDTTFKEGGQPQQTVQSVTVSGPPGSNSTTTTVTTNTSTGHQVTTGTCSDGGPSGSWSCTWETTVDGQVQGRGVHVEDDNGNSSDTRIEYDAKGGGTIYTISKDSDGNVTMSKSGFDKDGNPRDPSAGGGQPNSGSGGGQPDSGGGGGQPDSGSGGGQPDNPDSGGDNGGNPPEPSDGSGSGEMPSDCGTDEGPRIGGHLNGTGGLRVLGTLGDVGDGGPEDSGGDPGGDFPGIYQDLAGQVAGGGQSAGGSRGDGGWGQGGGSEGPPSLHFAGGRADMAGLGGKVPTDDWGDFNDPRVLVGFAASAFGVTVPSAVMRAIQGAAAVE
jgi:hypothetical protein